MNYETISSENLFSKALIPSSYLQCNFCPNIHAIVIHSY